MARNRTCDRCGAKASPHIPRQRVGEQMLCAGCAQADSHRMSTAAGKKNAGGPGAKRKPEPEPGGDFGWENDLGPEGHHPISSPLPNSVWEKYAQSRALKGKEPFDPAVYKDAEDKGDAEPFSPKETPRQTRLRLWRRKRSSLQATAVDISHGAYNLPAGPKLTEHLQNDHNQSFATAHVYGAAKHQELHDAGSDHTHDAQGNVVLNPGLTVGSPQPEPSAAAGHQSWQEKIQPDEDMSAEQLAEHLNQHHPETNGAEAGHGHGTLQTFHTHSHEQDKNDDLTHYHGKSEEPKPAGNPVLPHSDNMSDGELSQHYINHHGYTQQQADSAMGEGFPSGHNHHVQLHELDKHFDDATHSHSKPLFSEPFGLNGLKKHLKKHHGVADWELDLLGDHPEELKDYHDHEHSSTASSPDHTHPDHGPATVSEAAPAAAPEKAPEHSHNSMTVQEMQDHLVNDHYMTPYGAKDVAGGSGDGGEPSENLEKWHKTEHAKSDAILVPHNHDGEVSVSPEPHSSGEPHNHNSMTPQEMETHLQDHHDLVPLGVDNVKSGFGSGVGTSSENMETWHNNHHDPGLSPASSHDHGGPVKVVPHSHNSMTPQEMETHLQDHHQVSQAGVDNIKSNFGSGVGLPTKNLEKWHNNHHDPKPAGITHDHGGPVSISQPSAPEQLKHPADYGVSAMKQHVIEDHGLDEDHVANAIFGTLENTHQSHVVQMLHEQAHKDGKFKNPHEHKDWTGPENIHPGHTDVGVPFWGAPATDAQKSLAHLTSTDPVGGHGLTHQDVENLTTLGPNADDDQLHAEYEKLHGEIHKNAGAHNQHQHVPTIQPGVMNPTQVKAAKLKKHMKDFHGDDSGSEFDHINLHDPKSWGYKGHPGHEHPSWDQHGPVVQSLPSSSGGTEQNSMPKHVPHEDHPAQMSKGELANHLVGHAAGSDFMDDFLNKSFGSHEEMLQAHALEHASGTGYPHTHETTGSFISPMDGNNVANGHEPEIQTKTHAAVTDDSEALAHILKHHPNVNQEQYKSWGQTAQKPSMVDFHNALHTKGAKDVMGNTLPKAPDSHDHAPESGPPTTIAVGHHLVQAHGMHQDDVAAMTPAEFKAHHEILHLKKEEMDIGHGHDYPGGPQREPRLILPNTHHEMFRSDSKHVATQEWYHGTGTDYDGPPKNANELQEDHGRWGNYGEHDWNNHAGTHWTSLHEMAKRFGGDRVIHARLHLRNPVVYNSLNHMAHDAYDRLRAAGHMQDGGQFDNNHDDDNGYNHCCSDVLLDYSKGHHRSDGKYGMEAYRDSLRASGYDGIHVRNQADAPDGHWNAIPLSADQIEITHGGCRGAHNDERDDDNDEYNNNTDKTKRGWVHPKRFDHNDYVGKLGRLPDSDEVNAAHEAKKVKPLPFKEAVGRGDHDPYLNGREFTDGSGGHSQWCSHCDEDTDHETDDCDVSKYCDVCDSNGDHLKDEGGYHDWCDHCDDWGDHDSDDHEDEHGEKPDFMHTEGYCPHCDESTKENYNSTDCQNCGAKLPDWGKLAAFGKPVAPDKYKEDGNAGANYGNAEDASKDPGTGGAALAAHLYHHHKSEVGGKEFDKDDDWDEEALGYHHQWLHQNPKAAEKKGFTVDHTHKDEYGQFKPHSSMTPNEVHAHLLLSHVGNNGGTGGMYAGAVAKMTPEEAVEAHKKAHDADDAIAWGEKDGHASIKKKTTHTHDLVHEQGTFEPFKPKYPKGPELLDHLQDSTKHLSNLPLYSKELLEKHPGIAEALHQQMHENFGPSSEPHLNKAHVHDDAMNHEISQLHAVKQHLINDHGAKESDFNIQGKSIKGLMTLHHHEHTSNFPYYKDPDHAHVGSLTNEHPDNHTADTMKTPDPEPEQKEHISVLPITQSKWGEDSVLSHIQDHHPELAEHAHKVLDLAGDHGQNAPEVGSALFDMQKAHSLLHDPEDGPQHPKHYHYPNENKNVPEGGKTASLLTLSDLFEEVAL